MKPKHILEIPLAPLKILTCIIVFLIGLPIIVLSDKMDKKDKLKDFEKMSKM